MATATEQRPEGPVGAACFPVDHDHIVRRCESGTKRLFEACLDFFEQACYNSYRRAIARAFGLERTDRLEDSMSAAASWDHLEPASCPVPGSGTPGPRGHLRLVPTGPDVASPRRHSRITRRGRLAVTLLVTVAVVVLATSLASAVASPSGVGQPAVTVRPGQTLSEVAAAQLPQLPVRQGVVQLQLANDLTSLQVHAGQVLVVPAP